MRKARLIMAVLAALTVLMVPTAAQAAAGPEIQYANSDYEGNTGILLVGIRSADGISQVHADVKNGSGEIVASTDSFGRYRGEHDDEFQVWATQDPLILPGYGSYPVDVSVTDENGVTTSAQNVGSISYTVITFIDSITVRPATATYEKRSVTVTGILKGREPGTAETRRVPGAWIQILNDDWQDATTGQDGKFTVSIPISKPFNKASIIFQHDPNFPHHQPTYVETPAITIKPRPTRVTAVASATKVKVGEPVTISGTATWNTPSGWQPVPAGRITLHNCYGPDYCNPIDNVEVAADGTYSLTVTPFTGALRVYFSVNHPNGDTDPYVAVAQRDLTVSIIQPSLISDFTASRSESGTVHLNGHVQFPNGGSSGSVPVEFQFSLTGTGDWTTVADDENAYWDSSGYEFDAHVTEPRSGWWRARYPGVPRSTQPAVSPKIHVP